MKKRGIPLLDLLEDIFEVYTVTNQPVIIENDHFSYPVLEYLERNNFIISTDIPGPSDEIDLVLVKPMGCFTIKQESCFFCFDDEHDRGE